MKKLYRYIRAMYDEEISLETIDIHCREFMVIKETEKSYLIKIDWRTNKRVYKGHKGSFAFESKEDAMENFKKRTLRSYLMCKHNLEIARLYKEKYCKL